MVKTKKISINLNKGKFEVCPISKLKSSEIIDELSIDHSDKEFDELDKELLDRYPFSYYFKTKFEEIEQQIEQLNKLLRHYHINNKIVIEI